MQTISEDALFRRLGFENPWWSFTPETEIRFRHPPKRIFFPAFFSRVMKAGDGQALVLAGPLRAGKTVLLRQLVAALIEKGAEVNPASGPTPLIAAAWNDHTEVVKLLLDKEASVQGPPNAIKTPMHMVAEKGFTDTANILLDYMADPYIKDRSGKPPIYYATYHGHDDMVKLLISYGEDVTQIIPDGTTLLHLAAEKGHIDVAELLIQKGAVINAHNSEGDTPLEVAINHGHKKVANAITEVAIDKMKAPGK